MPEANIAPTARRKERPYKEAWEAKRNEYILDACEKTITEQDRNKFMEEMRKRDAFSPSEPIEIEILLDRLIEKIYDQLLEDHEIDPEDEKKVKAIYSEYPKKNIRQIVGKYLEK